MLLANTKIPIDREGYLKDLGLWSEQAAEEVAAIEGIVLTENHWEIIRLLRSVHKEYEHTPITRVFIKIMSARLGKDKGSSLYLLKLFPDSPMRKACKIAGLPKPTNCM
jgi:tRNA 2-thiouridine synthesizing protein E